MNDKQVIEFFVEQQVLEPSQAEDVLSEAELNGKSIEQAMVDGGFIDENGFYKTIAERLGTEFVDLAGREIASEILPFIPAGLARLHSLIPSMSAQLRIFASLLAGRFNSLFRRPSKSKI
jgi:hypothetical protein